MVIIISFEQITKILYIYGIHIYYIFCIYTEQLYTHTHTHSEQLHIKHITVMFENNLENETTVPLWPKIVH